MARRTDANQSEIVAALRKAGATVQCLHMVGHGCPDLLVSRHGVNYVLEVKVKGGKLTPDEQRWFDEWQGQATVVHDVFGALVAIGAAFEEVTGCE